jgi:hypothetical protein
MSTRTSLVLSLALLAAAPLGCTGDLGSTDDEKPGRSSGVTNPSGGQPGDDLDLDAETQGESPDLDHPEVDDGALPKPSAAIRRLSLAQLRASLPVLFGTEADGSTPITWRLPGGGQGLNQMAGSLGEPDYIEVTEENLEPSPMYAKFMDDMARDVCGRALAADLARPAGNTRVIVRRADFGDTVAEGAAAIDDNLRYLLLRLHAVKVAEDDASAIAAWRALFSEATAEASEAGRDAEAATVEGWRAVCVGLVNAPEFHLY